MKAEGVSFAGVSTGLVIIAWNRIASHSDREMPSAALNATDFIAEIILIAVFAALGFPALSHPRRSAPPLGLDVVSAGVVGAFASTALLTLRIEGILAEGASRCPVCRKDQSPWEATLGYCHLVLSRC